MSIDKSNGRWSEPALFQHLPPEECRGLLATMSVGRVAFNGPDAPQVLPVNYVVHRRCIFFRTAAGSALAKAMHSSRVAFEIDEIQDGGWSVVAVGDADLVDDPALLLELWGDQGPKPWAAGLRTQFVRITPIRVTGRRVVPG